MSDFAPPDPSGKDQLSIWLLKLNRFVKSLRVIESPDIFPSFSPNGVGLFLKKKGAGNLGSQITAYEVASDSGDKLLCKKVLTLGGSLELTSKEIAKPFTLRKTYGTGIHEYPTGDTTGSSRKTFFYHEGVARVQIDEAIEPPYVRGDRIMVAEVGEEGTGLAGVTLIDLNIDGRHWAWQKKLTKICVDDTEKVTYILRTGEFEI